MNAALVNRARAMADTGDAIAAVQMCRDDLTQDPDQPDVAAVATEIMCATSQPEAAIELCMDLGLALPRARWPWGLLAEATLGPLRHRPEQVAIAQSLRERPGDDVWAAMATCRELLRIATMWPQLVRLLHIMSERTWKIRDQVAIHEDLFNVLATKMSDPLMAREAREAGDEWRDASTIVQTYWTNLEANSGNPAVWDETEAFFRVNELWADLVRLLEASMEGSTDAEIVALWTEIIAIHEKMTVPTWDELLARMSGAPGPAVELARLRDRVKAHTTDHAKAKAAAAAPKEAFSLPIWLVATIAGVIGMVIATVIVLKYM